MVTYEGDVRVQVCETPVWRDIHAFVARVYGSMLDKLDWTTK